jgi:hypothetical protein
MSQILPSLPDISTSAVGGTAEEKIDSLVKQINDQNRLLTAAFQKYKGESYIPMNTWFGSYKLSASWTSLNGSLVEINFDDWEAYEWYWESTIFTDAGTGYTRLYNITDDEVVDGTELSTEASGEDNAEYFRTDILTKYIGTKQFKTQLRIQDGNGTTEYVNSMMSRMVFRISS